MQWSCHALDQPSNTRLPSNRIPSRLANFAKRSPLSMHKNSRAFTRGKKERRKSGGHGGETKWKNKQKINIARATGDTGVVACARKKEGYKKERKREREKRSLPCPKFIVVASLFHN